jgi:DNA topoisomerase-2
MNYLRPKGIFGSRIKNGKDAGAARYISVGPTNYLPVLFNNDDMNNYEYNYDDGVRVEPKYMLSPIPTVLLTGAEGIGTGWATSVQCYNHLDVISNLVNLIRGKKQDKIIPYYRGFKGKIIPLSDNTYLSVGAYQIIGENEILITEIPVGSNKCKSFSKYKEFLYLLAGQIDKPKKDTDAPKKKQSKKDADDDDESIISIAGYIAPEIIQDIVIKTEMSNEIAIAIKFKPGYLESQIKINEDYKFEKMLGLAVKFSTSNMYLFRNDGIHYYNNVNEIIHDFYKERMNLYIRRREYQINKYTFILKKQSAQYRFISEIIDDVITVYKKKKSEIINILESNKYPKYSNKFDVESEFDKIDADTSGNYDYLLNMSISSFSSEGLEKLKEKINEINAKLDYIKTTPVETIWLNEIQDFINAYDKENEVWKDYISVDVDDSEDTSSKPKSSIKLKRK